MFKQTTRTLRLGTIMLAIVLTSTNAIAGTTYIAKTSRQIPLSPGTGTNFIKTISVPPGSYRVSIVASVANFGHFNYNRCGIVMGTTGLNFHAANTGSADNYPLVVTIAAETAITTTVATTFTLGCLHDFVQSGEYVDPGATIIAEALPSLQVR